MRGCLISDFTEVDSTDTIYFDITCPDMTVISVIAVYAPSADSPSYWNTINKPSDHKLIVGDFNVTIDHLKDSKGYLTVITNWLTNGYFCDSFCDTHTTSSVRHTEPKTML